MNIIWNIDSSKKENTMYRETFLGDISLSIATKIECQTTIEFILYLISFEASFADTYNFLILKKR